MENEAAIPGQRARTILDSIAYATIATVKVDGTPWNTPVAAFHFDDEYTLYWASWHDNQHSQNIRDNGKAFVVVYDSTPANNNPSPGVYMQGEAFELGTEQEAIRAALVFKDDTYNPSDGSKYLGDYPRRIYKFVPAKIWMNSDDEVSGNFIDIREEAQE